MRDKKFRVIGASGEQLGILDCSAALSKAAASRLDLVIVAEKSEPPVARIMDYGKLVYEQKKKDRDQKKKNATQKVKEVKFSLRINPNDYAYKMQHALDFLAKGLKVKITIQFAGRELSHKEIGFELFEKIRQSMSAFSVADSEPKLMGRLISVGFTALRNVNFEDFRFIEKGAKMPDDIDDDDDDFDDEEPVAAAPKLSGKGSFEDELDRLAYSE